MLDYFTVTGGTIEGYASRAYNIPSAYFEEKDVRAISRARVRERVGAAVIVTGRITKPEEAEAVLASGAADVDRHDARDDRRSRSCRAKRSKGATTRFALAWDRAKAASTGCTSACRSRACRIATIGRELEWGALQPAAVQQTRRRRRRRPGRAWKRRASRHERGHEVTLYEREAELGGAIRIASRAPAWQNYRSIVDWLSAELVRQGVTVKAGRSRFGGGSRGTRRASRRVRDRSDRAHAVPSDCRGRERVYRCRRARRAGAPERPLRRARRDRLYARSEDRGLSRRRGLRGRDRHAPVQLGRRRSERRCARRSTSGWFARASRSRRCTRRCGWRGGRSSCGTC